ncbi:MAG: hypothetical protein ACHQF2_07305 [Flavobacteriales bacterium]
MGCFDDLIAVRGLCEPVTPRSLIYMDDVGLSLSDIAAFRTQAYPTDEDYFTKRSQFAIKEIDTLIFNHFNGNFLATSLIDDHRLGIFGNSQTIETGSNYMGIQMEFNPCDVYYKFEISEVSLRLNFAGDVDIEIYDLRQNKLLKTLTISTTSGQIVTDYLNELFYSSKEPMNLFIGYDATGIDSIRTLIKSGLCTGCGKKTCSNSYLTASGAQVSGSFIDANVTTIDHTGGLSIVYSIACDHSKWMCAYARSLALPIAYKTAQIMVSDALLNTGGERSTNSHTVNVDELAERYKFYTLKFNETFTSLLSNMKLPNNKCFHCNTPVTHKAFAI